VIENCNRRIKFGDHSLCLHLERESLKTIIVQLYLCWEENVKNKIN